jgi:hypothetical protein
MPVYAWVGDLECAVGRSECDEVESRLIPLDPTTGTSVAMHVWVSPVYASQQLSPRHCSYTSRILHTHGGGGVGWPQSSRTNGSPDSISICQTKRSGHEPGRTRSLSPSLPSSASRKHTRHTVTAVAIHTPLPPTTGSASIRFTRTRGRFDPLDFAKTW